MVRLRDVARPKYTQGTDLDAFLEGFGTKIPPLKMLKMVVQDNVIRSFKSTSMNDIYEKWGKRFCEFWDEQLEETKLSGHDCSHKGYSMLYLHQGMKDETT